jgi:hypothetical protein
MQETLEAAPLAPGVAEDSVFITDASVKIWKEFQRDGPADAAENLREVAAIASRIATQGADGLTYALAHGLRTGYFAFNAALGTLAFELNDRLRGDGSSNTRATYGPHGTNQDCTMQVQQMMMRGQTQVYGGIHTVLGDPNPNIPKVFRVWYG